MDQTSGHGVCLFSINNHDIFAMPSERTRALFDFARQMLEESRGA
jgi:hypothetical protein